MAILSVFVVDFCLVVFVFGQFESLCGCLRFFVVFLSVFVVI